jgi:hypothetical protein
VLVGFLFKGGNMSTRKLLGKLQRSGNELAMALIYGRKNPQDLFGTQIAHDIIPILYGIFIKNQSKDTLNLVLRSNGGVLEAPLPIVSLIREFFENFNVFIPENAHSAATLLSLGANKIIMSPLSSLSPVDPQINFPSPEQKENQPRLRFSVEDVAGYYKLLDKLNIPDEKRVEALKFLTEKITPAILGQIERVRELIQVIADRIIKADSIGETKKKSIIKKLTEDIPSHNYWISRAEAIEMGIPVEKADTETNKILDSLLEKYKLMLEEHEREIVIDIPDGSATLEKVYDRAFIETPDHSYSFQTKYVFHRNGKVDRSINEWRAKNED